MALERQTFRLSLVQREDFSHDSETPSGKSLTGVYQTGSVW